jgi:hypothetical protein
VEAVLQRLDRLTQEEARTTATQTLEAVYGLVKNIRVVMDGERSLLFPPCCIERWSLDGRVLMDGVHQTLGIFGS